jgi:hypothetical protein
MWYFPDSSPVPLGNQESEYGVYITRGPGVVRLHRKRNSMLQAGLFHCEVPDARGMDQRIYIGLYSDREGEGIKPLNHFIKSITLMILLSHVQTKELL